MIFHTVFQIIDEMIKIYERNALVRAIQQLKPQEVSVPNQMVQLLFTSFIGALFSVAVAWMTIRLQEINNREKIIREAIITIRSHVKLLNKILEKEPNEIIVEQLIELRTSLVTNGIKLEIEGITDSTFNNALRNMQSASNKFTHYYRYKDVPPLYETFDMSDSAKEYIQSKNFDSKTEGKTDLKKAIESLESFIMFLESK